MHTTKLFAVSFFLLLLSTPQLLSAVVAPSRRPQLRLAQVVAAGDPATSNSQTAEHFAALEQEVADARSAGDNAWMLMSSALVLLMTGPGLALFYG